MSAGFALQEQWHVYFAYLLLYSSSGKGYSNNMKKLLTSEND